MASNDLIFEGQRDDSLPARLTFGGVDVVQRAPTTVDVKGRLPSLTGPLKVSAPKEMTIRGRLPAFGGKVKGKYLVDVQRPVVNDIHSRFQPADALRSGLKTRYQQADTRKGGMRARFQGAQHTLGGNRTTWSSTDKLDGYTTQKFQEATRLPLPWAQVNYQQGIRYLNELVGKFQQGIKLRTPPLLARYQEAYRDRRDWTATRFQFGVPIGAGWREHENYGAPVRSGLDGRYQKAMKPPIGFWDSSIKPAPPTEPPCYVPGLPAELLFVKDWDGKTGLIFVCKDNAPDVAPPDVTPPGAVIVPVRRVYFVMNNVSLTRVSDGAPVPVLSLSLSLDVASWAWSFDAQLPASALGLVASAGNFEPVKLAASINGTTYHVLAESISRSRSFGSSNIRLSGRGHNAVLAAPYAPVVNFTNSQERTAQQLMGDVLQINGIAMGWDVDWGLADWVVPAGVFNSQGTWMQALTTLASAAGGYLLPHPSQQRIKVRHQYPQPPWQWGTLTPDFVLPSSVVAQESLTWVDKPVYNRVFVSGQNVGVLGQVTRTGTAGDRLAPMVVDALITDAIAARQRGLAVLADTGRQLEISLRLPVLDETGIIEPGAFVRYTDGDVSRIGIVRSTRVDAALPSVQQTLGVQSYA